MFFREGESDLQLRFIIHIIESNMHNARLYFQAECHRPRLCRFATPTPGFLEHCIVHSSIYIKGHGLSFSQVAEPLVTCWQFRFSPKFILVFGPA